MCLGFSHLCSIPAYKTVLVRRPVLAAVRLLEKEPQRLEPCPAACPTARQKRLLANHHTLCVNSSPTRPRSDPLELPNWPILHDLETFPSRFLFRSQGSQPAHFHRRGRFCPFLCSDAGSGASKVPFTDWQRIKNRTAVHLPQSVVGLPLCPSAPRPLCPSGSDLEIPT